MAKTQREIHGHLEWTEGDEHFTGEYTVRGNQITVILHGGGTKTEFVSSTPVSSNAYSILWDLIRARRAQL